MAEYLDAFARPNASKSYETKSDIKANLSKAEAAANAEIVNATQNYQDAFARPNAANGYEEPKKKEKILTAEPAAPASLKISSSEPAVKTAPIDTILFDDDSVSIETMTNLIFEDIGGQELINIARNDIVNGQKVSYQPIKNLSSIQQQYNPNNILGIQNTSDKYFSNFSIKLENRVPEVGSGPNGSSVYLDSVTGNLIIETINIENDEQVEVEITVSGILYEADFGEIVS